MLGHTVSLAASEDTAMLVMMAVKPSADIRGLPCLAHKLSKQSSACYESSRFVRQTKLEDPNIFVCQSEQQPRTGRRIARAHLSLSVSSKAQYSTHVRLSYRSSSCW